MNTKSILFILATISILLMIGCDKQEQTQIIEKTDEVVKLYEIQVGDKLSFSSPVELKNIENVGNSYDVWQITIPDDANAGKDALKLIIALLPDEYKTLLNGDETKALTELKGAYMGSSKPGEAKVTRTFLGQPTEGEKQSSKIPSPATIESYLAQTNDQQWLFVAVKYTDIISDEEVDGILNTLGSTLIIQ